MVCQLQLSLIRKTAFLVWLSVILTGCGPESPSPLSAPAEQPYVLVLGIAQDAGYPQASCLKNCCRDLWDEPMKRKMVACLGLVDPAAGQAWLFDATPDFKDQLQRLQQAAPLSGIFLTHAHMGHYTGLMQLGREAMGAKEVPVYVMPRMAAYLQDNGPWSQLVSLNNIQLRRIQADSILQLNERLCIRAFRVPHRDEFSETVGYRIEGPEKAALYIPDIDKWEKWERNINEMILAHDIAFVDGSFYQEGEIPGRDMSQIPHPFVIESMERFKALPETEKKKIHFIHLNHTNPLLWHEKTRSILENKHYQVAREGFIFGL